MSTRTLLPLSLAVLLTSACSDTTLGTKSFEETIDPFSVPGAPFGSVTVSDQPFVLPLNLKDQEGYSALQFVTSVKIRSVVFAISPETDNASLDAFADNNPDNFDFLSSLQLSLAATIDGVTKVQPVGSVPDGDPQIGSNASVMNLVVEDVDIRDFIEADDVKLNIVISGTTPVDFVVIDPVISYRVGLGVR